MGFELGVKFAYGETVTRQRANATADPYSGDSTALDWTSPDELTISGVAVAQGAFIENATPDRTRVDIDFTLYGEFASDVEPLDRMVVRGLICEVVGKRQDWMNPFSGTHAGSVIEVRRVAG